MLIIQIIIVLLLSVEEVRSQIKGYPQIENCQTNYTVAKTIQFPNKQKIQLFISWSPRKVIDKYPDIIYDNYTWNYRITRVNGPDEIPIKIRDGWLSRAGAILTIPEYGLTPGYYRIYPTAKPSNPKLPLPRRTKCNIFFKAVKPVVVISGGSYKTVPPHTEIELSGEESFDPNKKLLSNEGLVYTWTCKQKKAPTFCSKKPVSTSSKLTIPAKYVEQDDEIEVTLEVETAGDNMGSFTKSAKLTLTIVVLVNAAHLEMSCEKNCPPVSDTSNYEFITFMKVRCVGKCVNIKNDDYEWTVEPKEKDDTFKFDYAKDTHFGRNTYKFVIAKNVLKPGTYIVTVVLKETSDQVGKAIKELTFPGTPSVDICGTLPNSGTTSVTLFKIQCRQKHFTEPNFYELYAKSKKDPTKIELIMDGSFPLVMEKKFLLPSSDDYNFFVRIIKENGPPKELPVTPKVTSVISDQQPKEFINSLTELYGGKNPDQSIIAQLNSKSKDRKALAIQKFRSVVNEVVKKEFKDEELSEFVQNLKFKVVEDMLNAPFKSVNEIVQMSESISKLMVHNDDLLESEPLLAKFTTTICKKMLDKHVELVQNEKFPLNLGEKTNKVSSTLTTCLESNTNPNYKIVKPVDHNVTTEEPVYDEPLVTENYADYVDFNDEYYKNMEYLKESTFNIVNSSGLSAKVIAMTTAIGEHFIESFGRKSSTIVAKDYGKFLAQTQVRSRGVVLTPSQDFVDDEHPYDILMSTWSKDLMWWNPGKTKVATDIASIEFWHSTCKERVKHFNKSAQVFLTLNKEKKLPDIVTDTLTIPAGYTSLSDEDLSRKIKVRRITLPKNVALYVEFLNVSKLEALEVVITNYKFPSTDDFRNESTLETRKSTFHEFINEEDYNIWCYVGVLASKDVVAETSLNSLTYDLQLIMTCCIRWIEFNNSWVPTCKPGKEANATLIHCECTNFSVIAGYVQSVGSILQEVELPELELELQACYVIFTTVAVTFAFYCCGLLFVLIKRSSPVYFLADNNRKHRFAYLIVVKTGIGRRAGTTSNVIIRLVGGKASSDPHVLNYPDPKLRLLQRFGKDIFILTTEHHLGDLLKIELWFDCTGPNPEWYCTDILVYDMQQRSEWYFSVKRRLTVVKGESHISLTPTGKEPFHWTTFLLQFKFAQKYHTWYLWQSEDNLSLVKKLTVIFSAILMTYMVSLILHGVPSLHLKDGLDYPYYAIDVFTVFVAVVGSFLSFVVHIVIAYCFRFSKKQFSKYHFDDEMPFYVTLTCWLLLALLVTINTSFLIVLGFWVPFNRSLLWLTSCLIGIWCAVLIYETIFLFVQNILCKFELRYNISKRFNDIWVATEGQRWFLYKQLGDVLLRPYFKHLYKPMQTVEVKAKRVTVQRRRYVVHELEDLIMFSIYIVVLYIVILANKDSLIIRSKILLEELLEGVHTRTLGFHGMESVNDVYEYINTTLIPSLQPVRWYGNFVVSDPALMLDMTNKYIGVARLRQQRIKANVCRIAEPMKFLNISCHPELSLHLMETRRYGYGWGHFSEYLKFDRLRSIWQYSPEHKTGTFGTFGEFSVYPGGGYVGYLGRTLYNSHANFRKLAQKFWVDHKTRNVFIEFLTYNADYNVFNSVKLLFEQSASGYSFKNVEVDAVRMLFVQNEVQKITALFFVLFVLWVFVLSFKQTKGLIQKFRTFYKDVWFLVDFLIVLMSVVCIGLFILRMRSIGHYLDVLEKVKHNEFLNYFYLFYLEDFLKMFAATLVCIATVRLWKFLRFAMMFRVLERTLSMSVAPILSISLVFFVVVVSTSMAFVLLYGNYFDDIHTIVKTMRLLVTMSFKASEVSMSRFIDYPLAVFLFVVYGIILQIFFLIYIIIIVMAYSQAQMVFSTEVATYNIKHYVQEQVRYIPKFIKYKYTRLKAGQAHQDKVEAKPDKFVYSGSFSVPTARMTTMKYIMKCVIRNMKPKTKHTLTTHDVSIMSGLGRQLLLKSQDEEVEVFFKGRIKGKKILLIDEDRIFKIAKIVNLLLQEKPPEMSKGDTRNKIRSDRRVELIRKNQNTLKTCSLKLKLVLRKINSVELKFSKIINTLRSVK